MQITPSFGITPKHPFFPPYTHSNITFGSAIAALKTPPSPGYNHGHHVPFYLAPTWLLHAPSQSHALSAAATSRGHQQHARTSSAQKCSMSTSPDDRDNKRTKTFRDPNAPLPCCAVCLGRNPHRTIQCTKTLTWDGKHDTIAERINKALWTKDGKQLCTAWQRDEGCDSTRHDSRHVCSGCGATTHGAQHCPRAQKI